MAQKEERIFFNNSLKNFCNIAVLMGSMTYGFYTMIKQSQATSESSGTLLSEDDILSYCCYGIMLFFFCLISPQIITTMIGIVFLGPFNQKKIKTNAFCALDLPWISVRVVTRGTYPELVSKNVVKNIDVIKSCGITKFVLEVVTDEPLYINETLDEYKQNYVETVVPENYRSKCDTRKKARALQYCLEEGVSTLSKDDYVVHLDEETLLTTDSMNGIINFINEGNHMIGQGIITYGMLPCPSSPSFTWVQHHLCTIADSVRVSDDVGKNKTQFKLLHKPYFGMKGSFVVTKFEAERKVTWDFGPAGSVAEDAWFGLRAIDLGYSIDFIEGDMLERSPFTLYDFIKQRQRWMQGLFMVAFLSPIRIKTKLFLIISVSSWLVSPLYSVLIILQKFVLINPPGLIITIQRFMEVYFVYLHIVGYMRQFEFSFRKFVFLIPNIAIGCLSNAILENAATILAIKCLCQGDCYDFHVVQKEIVADNPFFSNTPNGKRNGFNKTNTRHEKER
jgi:egghead protein (zeste-white 4 protein)